MFLMCKMWRNLMWLYPCFGMAVKVVNLARIITCQNWKISGYPGNHFFLKFLFLYKGLCWYGRTLILGTIKWNSCLCGHRSWYIQLVGIGNLTLELYVGLCKFGLATDPSIRFDPPAWLNSNYHMIGWNWRPNPPLSGENQPDL